MPYALVPDNYTLKKVTPAQEAAVHSKRRHDDVVAFLSNETTPVLIGATGLIAIAPILAELFFTAVGDSGINLSDKQKEVVKKGITQGALPGLLAKELEKTGQAIAPIAKFFRIGP